MRKQNTFLHLALFITLSVVSIFLTSMTLYAGGEVLFLFFIRYTNKFYYGKYIPALQD